MKHIYPQSGKVLLGGKYCGANVENLWSVSLTDNYISHGDNTVKTLDGK